MNQKDLDTPATKRDLEILAAQIVTAVNKALEPIYKILESVATKNDINKLQSDVTDIKRRVIDLEADTPTKEEFSDLKEKVDSIYARRLS